MSKINLMGRRGYLLSGLLAILFSISALAVVLNIDWLRDLGNDLIYDSKNHHLSCDELPASEEVVRVVLEHQETVRKIEEVNPGFVMVQINTHTCPGRSDIVILFGAHRDRVEIEKIIDGDTFFGIPYRLINV